LQPLFLKGAYKLFRSGCSRKSSAAPDGRPVGVTSGKESAWQEHPVHGRPGRTAGSCSV
jgi:hypothetical protein